jgi:hypothetical protein
MAHVWGFPGITDKPGSPPLMSIEIADPPPPISHFFLDSASFKSIATTLFVLVCLLSLHLFFTYRMPTMRSYKDEYFPLTDVEPGYPLELELSLDLLNAVHRFVQVNCTLIRRRPSPKNSIFVLEYSSRIIFLKKSVTTNAIDFSNEKLRLNFWEGGQWTNSFTILHKEVGEFDSIAMHFSFSAEFDEIDGMSFRWCYGNPLAMKASRISKYLLSVLVFYMLIVYISYLTFDKDFFTQVCCLILGTAGVFASNPFSVLFERFSGAQMFDYVLMAFFIACFRFFCILQIDLIRSGRHVPNLFLTITCGIFFAVYATFDAAASFDRAQYIAVVDPDLELSMPTANVLEALHMTYGVMLAVVSIVALLMSNGFARRRLFVFILFGVAGLGATIFAQVICPQRKVYSDSLFPEMLHTVLHMITGAFLLFLMRSDPQQEYDMLNPRVEVNGGDGALQVEEVSGEGEIGFGEEEDFSSDMGE